MPKDDAEFIDDEDVEEEDAPRSSKKRKTASGKAAPVKGPAGAQGESYALEAQFASCLSAHVWGRGIQVGFSHMHITRSHPRLAHSYPVSSGLGTLPS